MTTARMIPVGLVVVLIRNAQNMERKLSNANVFLATNFKTENVKTLTSVKTRKPATTELFVKTCPVRNCSFITIAPLDQDFTDFAD